MNNSLSKLNRLRVNAGKPELKAWKASALKLQEAITTLEAAGFTDALPGANIDAAPHTDDPQVAAARPEEEKKPILDSPMAKNIAKPTVEKPKPTPLNLQRVSLARGLDTDSYARACREKVKDHRAKEKADEKAAKPEKAPALKITGKVDAKKNPEKAKRQEEHVKTKREARATKPAKEANANEITIAELSRELNIDPSVARAKLRRQEDKIIKLHTKGQDRWTFPRSATAQLTAILTG
jgi:hypothetical protein